MFRHTDILDLANFNGGDTALISDEVEQEITSLLRAKAPELSSKNSFRIAESLIDTAVATIATLRSRVAALEVERDQLSAQESEWETLMAKWRDMAIGLKAHVRDLEGKLAQSHQRIVHAELRAQTAEDEIVKSQHGPFELCDKIIAAFGVNASLLDRVGMAAGEAAGSC